MRQRANGIDRGDGQAVSQTEDWRRRQAGGRVDRHRQPDAGNPGAGQAGHARRRDAGGSGDRLCAQRRRPQPSHQPHPCSAGRGAGCLQHLLRAGSARHLRHPAPAWLQPGDRRHRQRSRARARPRRVRPSRTRRRPAAAQRPVAAAPCNETPAGRANGQPLRTHPRLNASSCRDGQPRSGARHDRISARTRPPPHRLRQRPLRQRARTRSLWRLPRRAGGRRHGA